ncbi:uncharacterized protein LOC135120825 [Zophobas morio]|uniref:uncharacterized protein LOC135120825 n=1 Tax=Zophobas morio TaxID=2755281 RepID=UPI003083CE33
MKLRVDMKIAIRQMDPISICGGGGGGRGSRLYYVMIVAVPKLLLCLLPALLSFSDVCLKESVVGCNYGLNHLPKRKMCTIISYQRTELGLQCGNRVRKDKYFPLRGATISVSESFQMEFKSSTSSSGSSADVHNYGTKECSVHLTDVIKSKKSVKYCLSSDEASDKDDPYADPEFTDDEYIPDESTPSTGRTITPISFEPLCTRVNKQTVRRRLFTKEDKTCLDSGFVGERPQMNRIKKACSKIKIYNSGKVILETIETFHEGQYHVGMFSAALSHSDERYLSCHVFDQSINHDCKLSTHGKNIGFLYRQEKSLMCHILCCIPPNVVLEGTEIKADHINQNITSLIMQPIDSELKSSTKLKGHYCFYCGKLRTCMGRHLQKVHAKETEVKNMCFKPTKEKNKLLRQLRLKGDQKYNLQVNLHQRIPVRKPIKQKLSESIHCPTCSGLFAKRNFAKHELKCSKRAPDRRRRRQNALILDQRQISKSLEEKLHIKLVSNMLNDEIGVVAKNDQTILLLGIHLCKLNSEQRFMDNTRSQMRRCARLLLIIKQLDPSITSFAECFMPSKYKLIMQAIRNLTGSRDEEVITAPSLALQFGPLLTTIASRLKIQLLENNVAEEDPRMVTLRNFEFLHKQEFKNEITKTALKTANIKKVKTAKEIPSQEDVKIFNEYLKKILLQSTEQLKSENFDIRSWKTLGECILCQIMIYNRRRPGESSRMLLEDYKTRKQLQQENYKHLNRLQRILAEKFSFMFILGKRHRPLNLLLKSEHIEALDFYLSFREQAQIQESNVFLFAFNNNNGHLSASVALRKFVHNANLKAPRSFTGTYLRKQVATQAQILDLSHNEMQHVADYMGHDLNVHLSNYRLNDASVNIFTLSRFLSVIDGDDDIEKYRGKRLEDLEPFIPDEDYDIEDTNPDEPSTEKRSAPVNTPQKKRKSPAKLQSPSPSSRNPTTQEIEGRLKNPSLRLYRSPLCKRGRKLKWTVAELDVMHTEFKYNLQEKKLPKLSLCRVIQRKYSHIFQKERSVGSIYTTYTQHAIIKSTVLCAELPNLNMLYIGENRRKSVRGVDM